MFSEICNFIFIPFFVLFCLIVFWTMFVRFIFFCLKIQKPVLRAWAIFIPLYCYFIYFLVVYVVDYIVAIFWYIGNGKSHYVLLKDFISEILLDFVK